MYPDRGIRRVILCHLRIPEGHGGHDGGLRGREYLGKSSEKAHPLPFWINAEAQGTRSSAVWKGR